MQERTVRPGWASWRMRAVGVLAVTALLFLGACGGADTPDRLVVANWNDYGSDLEWVLEEFEERTGAEVVHQYFDSLEEMLNLLRTAEPGDIDVVLPNVAYLHTAASEGLIQPVDVDRLEHYEELSPVLRELEENSYEGEVIGVPWTWGSTSLAYNHDVVDQPVTSWDALWDDQYAGQVAFFDDPVTAVMTAAIYAGEDPRNPDLDVVRAALEELHDNVQLYWSSADDWLRPFETEAIVMGNVWSGLAGTQIGDGAPLTYVIPDEGGVGWADSWAIVSGANEDLAHEWIDYMSSVDFQARWAQDTDRSPPAPANEVAVQQLPQETIDLIQADPAGLDDLYIQWDIPEETRQEWVELWQEIRAG